jgi:hypothetical protein
VWTRTNNAVLEVRKLDKDGEKVLDSGADVDPTSLALSGLRVYWLKGGTPMTALLRAR